MQAASVFLSYSHADSKVAHALRERLEAHGISVWLDTRDLQPGSDWSQRIREAVRKARAILVLVGSEPGGDEAQRFTWMEALQAVWGDSSKVLVPVLLPGAKLPAFVVGASGEPDFQAVRIHDERALDVVVQALEDSVLKAPLPRPATRGEHRDFSAPELPVFVGPMGHGGFAPSSPIEAQYPLPGDAEPSSSVVELVTPRGSLRSEVGRLKKLREERLAEIETYTRFLMLEAAKP